jgi:hypothetical protein
MDPISLIAASGIIGAVVAQLVRIAHAKITKKPANPELIAAAADLADSLARAAADRRVTAKELAELSAKAAALLVKLG